MFDSYTGDAFELSHMCRNVTINFGERRVRIWGKKNSGGEREWVRIAQGDSTQLGLLCPLVLETLCHVPKDCPSSHPSHPELLVIWGQDVPSHPASPEGRCLPIRPAVPMGQG